MGRGGGGSQYIILRCLLQYCMIGVNVLLLLLFVCVVTAVVYNNSLIRSLFCGLSASKVSFNDSDTTKQGK